MIKIYFILLLVFHAVATPNYRKVIHHTNPNAKCLDGTSPALYLHSGGDTTKFIIYFMGGGYCAGVEISGTLQTCYQRTKTQFGSSDLLPEQFVGEGYLSTDPNINQFANWTKIIINYCDGSLHQGNAQQPIKYKDMDLYFRGSVNVKSHFQWLTKQYDFSSAQNVMLTGVSAGGIATFLWTKYVKSLLNNPSVLFAVIDSGIFLNEASVRTGMLKLDVSFNNLYRVANAQESTPLTECNEIHKGQQYKCLFLEYAYPFLDGPNLWINSQYDIWSIPNILDVFCIGPCQTGYTLSQCNQTQIKDIEAYRQKYISLIDIISKQQSNNIWSIACANHGYGLLDKFYNVEAQKSPWKEGETVRQAILRFLNGGRVHDIDYQAWPNNINCAY